jgi:chaperone modulatory protein CbpM
MQMREFVMQVRIETEDLDRWISAGWLIPQTRDPAPDFSEIDLARAQLIRDLFGLGVNDEGIPIVLDLVDQLHGLRRALRESVALAQGQRQGRD